MASFIDFLGRILKPAVTLIGRNRLSPHSGEIDLKGLSEPVEIRRDARGVPYIYAKNEKDLFFAQGFVHAQDRFWQMEVNRRLANGTLAEVFGPSAVETDRISRTFGFARLGKADLELLEPEFVDRLKPYVAGVNAYLKQARNKLPIEFRLAGYKPDLWTLEDVLSFSKMMVMRLSIGWGHEVAAMKMLDKLGQKGEELINLRYPKSNPVTLPEGIEHNVIEPDGKFRAIDGPYMKQANGSNAWAVTGSRTDTGMPYLCSDPHLTMLMPAIWYLIYMEGGDFRCQGASIPGLPLIQIGHNRHISWGITLAFTDIQDVFAEEFNPENPKQYKYKGDWKDVTVTEEKIKIKGVKEPYVEKVWHTEHGVIISSVLDNIKKRKLALATPALNPNKVTEAWWHLDTATGWDDFVNAMSYMKAPGLNVVYADVEGNIGYWVTGQSPIRGKGKAKVPAPGGSGDYDWTGFVPFEEMPHTLNPERGHVISCNHKIVNEDYPYFLGDTWMNGYRAERLEELMASKEKLGISDFKAFHMDFFSIPGKKFAGYYDGLTHEDGKVQTAMYTLAQWDGHLVVESVAGTLYMVAKQMMSDILFTENLGAEGRNLLIGKGPNELYFPVTEYQGHDAPLLFSLLADPKSEWVKACGGREQLLKDSMAKAVEWLKKHHGNEMSDWKWGNLHKVEFPHPMAVRKPLDRVFNVGPFPIGGDTDTVCQTAFKPQSPYNADQACPSYRQIVDLKDFNRSIWVLPPGQSGQLGSKHYDDQVKAWLDGKYFPMVWDRTQVESETQKILNLKPFHLKGE